VAEEPQPIEEDPSNDEEDSEDNKKNRQESTFQMRKLVRDFHPKEKIY
jgi:hypothetical protein